MPDLSPGTVLGERFELHGVLGRGGMATVYLAQDRRSGERIALKLLHAHLAADPGARRRLERELETAGRLEHEGVLVALEQVDLDGQVGLVLPLHTGRTLAEVVAMDGPLPPEQVRRLGLRLAEALVAAHRAGVLHRDLTARNVLVDEHGSPVLTDFGLARLHDQRTARSTALLGTAGYVAPEVLAGRRADPQSDLYGLGAVLYLAATGQEAFAGPHPQAALQAQLLGQLRPITEQVPDFPPWLDQAVRRLLDPDPAKRPQGAAALAAALEEGRAPDAPPVTGPLLRAVVARLPAGTWTVAVRESGDSDMRKARRALRRARQMSDGGRGELGRIVGQLSDVVGQVTGWSEESTVEERMAGGVARVAGLPPEALRPAQAMQADRYRLVAHVDRPTAEALADHSRRLGLRATVHTEDEASGLGGWLLSRWWVLIPLMWIAYPGLMTVGAPDWTVFAFVAATVFLSTVVGPLAARQSLPERVRRLPIAYTGDLAPHLAPGFHPHSAQPPTPAEQSRGELHAAQASGAIDALEAAIAAHSADLSEVVAQDLRGSARELRREVASLQEEAARLEALLGAPVGEAHASQGWAAERLARLETLARGGQSIDPAEQRRLQAAVDAHQAALSAELALDSQRTATLARLLEIGATAQRLARELALEQSRARQPDRALEDLHQRAVAAAAARRELG